MYGLAMHLETLLYMLLQSQRTLPPPGPMPDFQALARDAQKSALPNEWIKVPATTLIVGMDDAETDSGPKRYFGWDNEKPVRRVQVPAFEAKARPLTNGDYAKYLTETGRQTLPASWSLSDDVGQKNAWDQECLKHMSVKTVYGPMAFVHALAWPVSASYDELAGCAKWMGWRIPTADEVRSIYNHVDLAKTKEAEKVLTKKISAVNGYHFPPPLHLSSFWLLPVVAWQAADGLR